jgi:hypothetical protein
MIRRIFRAMAGEGREGERISKFIHSPKHKTMNTKWAGPVAQLGEIRTTYKLFLRKREACVTFGRSGMQNYTILSRILTGQAKWKCHGLFWHTIRTMSDKK